VAIEALSCGWCCSADDSLELTVARVQMLVDIGEHERAFGIAQLSPCYSRQTVGLLAAHRWEEAISALSRVPGTCVANLVGQVDSLAASSSIPFVAFLAAAAVFCTHKDVNFTAPLDRILITLLLWACGNKRHTTGSSSSSSSLSTSDIWAYCPTGGSSIRFANIKFDLPPTLGGSSNLFGSCTFVLAKHLVNDPLQITPVLRSIVMAPTILCGVTLEMAFQLVERCASRSALEELFTIAPFSEARSGGTNWEKATVIHP
jgi:hypothetical protein